MPTVTLTPSALDCSLADCADSSVAAARTLASSPSSETVSVASTFTLAAESLSSMAQPGLSHKSS
eukprot:7376698-Prymnesium_polylepis.1